MTPLLPLETFRRQMGFHPFHFYQLANSTIPVTSSCDAVVYQYAWQVADAVGRSEILEAIERAEDRLREYLDFSVAPRYTTETLPWAGGWGSGRWPAVTLREGEIRAIGTEKLTLIGTPSVTYTDADNDGVDDSWIATIATSVTDTSQIAVYVPANDRLDGESAGDRWRIQPVQVSISGGLVTVRGRMWLMVQPIMYEGVASNTIDPNDSAARLSAVEIYQRTTETNGTTVATSQAVLTWESSPCHGWWCCCDCCTDAATAYSGSPYDPAAVAQAVARVGIRDARLGIVTPAEAAYDATTGIWSSLDATVCGVPDRVTVRYLAGLPLDSDGQMQAAWRPIVALMAAAELARPVCGCEAANRELYRWQVDLARTAGNNDEQFGAISAADLNNPFGTRRGHVYAWRRVEQLPLSRGILV